MIENFMNCETFFFLQMDNPVSTSINYIGSQNNATHYSQVNAALCRLVTMNGLCTVQFDPHNI